MTKAGTNQFWLPTVMRATARINGDFDPPPGQGKRWMAGLQISEKHMLAFLESITPALRALLMAGYQVPYIDIGFQSLPGLPGIENHYFRIDFQDRAFSMQNRTTEDNAQLNYVSVVKLKIEKISGLGQSKPIDLSTEKFEEFIAAYPGEHEAEQMDAPFRDLLDARFGPGIVKPMRRAGRSVWDYRSSIVSNLLYDFKLYDNVAAIPIDIGYDAQNLSGSLVRDTLLKAIRIGVFDSIRWYVGSLLVQDTEAAFDAYETALEDDSLSAQALRQITQAGPVFAGMLWALNPYFWDQLTASSTLDDADRVRLGDMRQKCAVIWGTLGSTRRDWYSDYSDVSQETGENQSDDYSGFKITNLLHASAFENHLTYAASETPLERGAFFFRHQPLIHFIEQQLVGPDIYSDDLVKKGNKEKTMPGYDLNGSFVGTVKQYAKLSYADDNPFGPFVTNIRLHENNFMDDYKDLIQSINGGIINLGEGRSVVNRLKYKPYFDLIFSMFNIGIFSIQHVTGDLSRRVDRARVYATGSATTENMIILNHTDYPDISGVQMRLSADLGYSIDDSIAWEFIPSPPAEDTQALRQALEPMQPELAAQLASQLDRLILVLAPGVSLNNMTDWPTTCKVEVYRVQSHGQVPGDGESINTDILEAPMTIMAFDDLEPMEGETRSLDSFIPLFTEKPEIHPMVIIKPFRRGRMCGVVVSTKPQGGDFNRGVDGIADVELIFDSHSGDARYAIDLRYRILERVRAVDSETFEVSVFNRQLGGEYTTTQIREIDGVASVIQFQLIVHKTSNVVINIKDNNVGYYADYMPRWMNGEEVATTFSYSFFDGPIRAIADDGSVLQTTTSYMLELPNKYDPSSPSHLSRDDGPMDRLNAANFVDAGKNVIDVGIGFIPIVGDGADVVEFLIAMATGMDKWGRPVTGLQKAIMFGCILLPLVSPSMFRALKHAPISETGDVGGDLFASILENQSKGL